MTVLLPWPLAIVTVPLLGVRLVTISLMLTIVPAPSLMSGLAAGKLVSLVIGKNPPTSSTKSITRASIAAVVATKASLELHGSPLAIVSELS